MPDAAGMTPPADLKPPDSGRGVLGDVADTINKFAEAMAAKSGAGTGAPDPAAAAPGGQPVGPPPDATSAPSDPAAPAAPAAEKPPEEPPKGGGQ